METLKRITGGVNMSEVVMLHGDEPRRILQTAIEKKVPAIMSYLSKGKWRVAKVLLTNLGANRFHIEGARAWKKPRPINIQINQPVGISFKHAYGKFVFGTTVLSFEPSSDPMNGGAIVLEMPDRIEVIQRRSYFRVNVPESLKVNVLLWHRSQNRESDPKPQDARCEMRDYCQGRLVDLSAGGAQVAIDAESPFFEESKIESRKMESAVQRPDFKKGQFIGLRFTPMPYETPLVLNAQIRNVLPTADAKSICLGLQIVGLEASPEGRQVLTRLVGIVERYYQINQSGAKQQETQGSPSAM